MNWNGYIDTIECLESVYQITYPNYDVVLVDNASEDGSIAQVISYAEGKIAPESSFFAYSSQNKPIGFIQYTKKMAETGGSAAEDARLLLLPFNRRLRLIQNDKNYGFAEANNVAIRYALKALNPDYFLLLNNDTVVDQRFLGELVAAVECDATIGIAGPTIYYYDFEGKRDVIHFTGGRFDAWRGQPRIISSSETDARQYNRMREVDFVNGASLLARRSLVDQIGLLSTDYFLYWEENDWCIRAAKSGFKSVYVPRAKIWHKILRSITKTGGKGTYYAARGRFYFMMKYGSNGQLLGFLTYFFFLQFWVNLGRYLRRRKLSYARMYVRGVLAGLFTRPPFI